MMMPSWMKTMTMVLVTMMLLDEWWFMHAKPCPHKDQSLSWVIGWVRLDMKSAPFSGINYYQYGLFIMLILTWLYVMYCSFTNAYTTRILSSWKFFHWCGPIAGPSVGMAWVLWQPTYLHVPCAWAILMQYISECHPRTSFLLWNV